VYFTFTVQWDL